MKSEIFEKITRVIIISGLIAISCFVLALCLFPFKDGKPDYASAFNFFASMTSAIATIGAGLIATLLFNDWKSAIKFDVAKETLLSLVRLKSHIDKNYSNAKSHLDSYFLHTQQQPPSNEYISQRINKAQNSAHEMENYKTKLDLLLTDFFEKVDIFEITLNTKLINEEDKESIFRTYMSFIPFMYTCAHGGDLEKIKVSNALAPKKKENFENNHYNELFKKLSKQAKLENLNDVIN